MVEPPIKDYYKESIQGPQIPIACPLCKKKGRLAAHLREIGRRIPSIVVHGMATCYSCGESVLRYNETVVYGLKVWYCEDCQICICAKCQGSKVSCA